MITWRTLVAVALAATLGPLTAVVAHAQEPPRGVSVAIDGRVWATTGTTEMSTRTSRVDPLSELRWRGVDSIVTEVSGEVTFRRFVILATVGGGHVDDGVLIDEDFSVTDRRGRFSRTRSPVDDGSVIYGAVDFGGRVLTWGQTATRPAATLDVLGGHQFLRETYDGFGATSAFPDAVPAIPTTTLAITHEYLWHSVRASARVRVPLDAHWSVGAMVSVIPWSHSELRDTHHLRSDLRQNPSFLAVGEGGWGVQAEGRVAYRVWNGLSVEAGYRYWRIDSGEGTTEVRGVTGTSVIGYNGAITERYGPFFGVRYQF